jgi:hypothetical protein
MEMQFLAEFGAGEATIPESGKEAELDSSEQYLGIPEAECGLQDGRGSWRMVHAKKTSLLRVPLSWRAMS